MWSSQKVDISFIVLLRQKPFSPSLWLQSIILSRKVFRILVVSEVAEHDNLDFRDVFVRWFFKWVFKSLFGILSNFDKTLSSGFRSYSNFDSLSISLTVVELNLIHLPVSFTRFFAIIFAGMSFICESSFGTFYSISPCLPFTCPLILFMKLVIVYSFLASSISWFGRFSDLIFLSAKFSRDWLINWNFGFFPDNRPARIFDFFFGSELFIFLQFLKPCNFRIDFVSRFVRR